MSSLKSIALLDSGVGGLTVVKEIFKQLPKERIVYFGDTARMPYGPRPYKEVQNFVFEIVDFLKTQDIKLIVVACNSASAAGLPLYRERFSLPTIGVIEPGIRAALRYTKNNKIGVIGTTGTINSGAYKKVIKRINPQVDVYSQPCPLFVLLVENNLVDSPEAKKVAEEYLSPLKEAGVDALILGCTHYPLLTSVIQEVMGEGVKLISSAEETAAETKHLLGVDHNYSQGKDDDCSPKHRFFVSGNPKPFEEIGKKLLNTDIKAYQVIL